MLNCLMACGLLNRSSVELELKGTWAFQQFNKHRFCKEIYVSKCVHQKLVFWHLNKCNQLAKFDNFN